MLTSLSHPARTPARHNLPLLPQPTHPPHLRPPLPQQLHQPLAAGRETCRHRAIAGLVLNHGGHGLRRQWRGRGR